MVKNTVGKKNNTYFKTFWGIIILGLIVLLPLISAQMESEIETEGLQLNPFADTKSYTKVIQEDMSAFIKEEFNEKYGVITLQSNFLWIPTGKAIEYSLTSNTETCIINCEAEGRVTLYEDSSLFDGVQFKTLAGEDTTILSSKYYLFNGMEDNYVDVPIYKEVCEDMKTDYQYKTVCNQEVIGTSKVNQPIEVWNEYNGETLQAGDYRWKIKGVKNASQSVDFIPLKNNKEFSEWAVWTAGLNIGLRHYYTLNELGGTANDSLGTINLSSVYTIYGADGKIGKAINVSQDIAGSYLGGTGVLSGYNWTMSFWIKPESLSNAPALLMTDGTTQFGWMSSALTVLDSTWKPITSVTPINVWTHIVIVANSSAGVTGYMNGGKNITVATPIGINGGSAFTYFGQSNQIYGIHGLTDEVGFWNRSLSATEISDLYNGGTGITYTNNFDSRALTTTQSSPVNYFNTTDNTVSISCNYTSTANNISSVNLTVWDSSNNIDYQNTEVLAGEVTNYNKTWTTSALTDGTYNWSCGGFGKAGVNATSGNRTFTLDTTKPTITINSPIGNQGLKVSPYTVLINATTSDLNLQSCWYNLSYNSTINMTTCNTSFSLTVPNNNIANTIYFYANDSLGNQHENSSTWTLNGFVNNFQWANTTLEGSLNNFYADINLTSGVSINIPKLIYNNTNYTAISTLISGNKYRVSSSINAPSIASDTNITFYWNILLSDSSTYISNTFNQSVFNFSLDNCSAYSYPLFNMTLYDEDLQTKLDGSSDNTSIEVTLTMSDLSNIVIFNYSTKINNMNSAAVCLQNNLSGDNYYLDGIIKYSSLGRFNEFYNIQKYQINSSNVNLPISLYDLNTSTGTEFKITYKDSNFVPVSGALIYLQRKYISEGVYKTVEIPKTGAEGYALAHVVRNDVIYNILVMKNGVLLATFADIVADCQNPTLFSCNINLNSYGSSVLPSSYISGDDLTFSMVYNKSTRTISSSYAIPSGVPSTMSLNVTVFDSLGNTTVFNDNLLSASGELSGVVPSTFGNGTVIATLYKDGVVVGKSIISLAENPTDIYGGSLVFIALFGIILIIGLGISDNPMVMGIMLAIGAVVLVALNIIYSPSLLGVGATILWLIIGIVLVLIKGSDRQ